MISVVGENEDLLHAKLVLVGLRADTLIADHHQYPEEESIEDNLTDHRPHLDLLQSQLAGGL